MANTENSLKLFGWYVLLTGFTLMAFPNVLLNVFGFPATQEVWIRVLGLVAAVLGYYYLLIARYKFTPMYMHTVVARAIAFLVFCALPLAGWVSPAIVLFGVVDLAGAIWTWKTLPR